MEITKREVLTSISIIAIMLVIGMWISSKITDARMDRDGIYNKAVKIESSDMFEYGMRTNVGNAFVYGDLKAVDTVAYPEIGGKYMYIRKVKERYTMHTRQVPYTVMCGKTAVTKYRTEIYWSWDVVDSESKKCNEVSFLDVTFDSSKIDIPMTEYIETIKKSSNIRYKYYGVKTEHTGTIFTDLRDNTISDNSAFYEDKTIDETVESLQSMNWNIVFWIFWSLFMATGVFVFYYIDNRWLE